MTKHEPKTATLSELISRIDRHGDSRWWDVIGVSIDGLDEAIAECEESDEQDMTGAYAIAAAYAREHADDLYCVCWPDHVSYPLYDSDASYRLAEVAK